MVGQRLQPESFTYGDLAAAAARMLGCLRSLGAKDGDRVVLACGRADTFVATLVACMAGRLLAVPAPAPGLLSSTAWDTRLRSIISDCQPVVAVADRAAEPVHGVPIVAAATDAAPERLERADPDDPAVLQYTSGSTAEPRGVILTHRNIGANCCGIGAATAVSPDDRGVSWLPLHHDMGLIGGVLFPLYARMPVAVMPAQSFIMRPVSWLAAISDRRATYSVAPNFAYALCADKIPDRSLQGIDLSSWRLAFNGAEPIDPGTAERFTRRFASWGLAPSTLFPVYGLAEATLAVTFPPCGRPARLDHVERSRLVKGHAAPGQGDGAATFVSVGVPLPHMRVEICRSDTDEPCPERVLGEIVVSGPSVSPGEWARPRRQGPLRTGDLGYVADGELYVVDRIKDLIIVGGRKFAPADIERCATAVDGVRAGRAVAFGIPSSDGTQSACLVAEMDTRTWRSPAAIQRDVEAAVRKAHALTLLDVRLCPPGTLPRTSSGKLQRSACRSMYANGTLPGPPHMLTRLWIRLLHALRKMVARLS